MILGHDGAVDLHQKFKLSISHTNNIMRIVHNPQIYHGAQKNLPRTVIWVSEEDSEDIIYANGS